jgi:hypothetical protein
MQSKNVALATYKYAIIKQLTAATKLSLVNSVLALLACVRATTIPRGWK